MEQAQSFVMSVHDFDKRLLPAHARKPGTDAFRTEVSKILTKEYESFGGKVRIIVDDKFIRVEWTYAKDSDPQSTAIRHLERGDYQSGVAMLNSLLRQYPNDSTLLYNLGMALSDLGQLADAERMLRKGIEYAPDDCNLHVALGVALQRQKRTSEAISFLRKALNIDSANPYAHRNLGACLLMTGATAEALEHLQAAAKSNPDDAQAWFGLGQAQLEMGNPDEADSAFIEVIRLDPSGELGESAKSHRSKIGQDVFRERGGGAERPDAVMYCLAALEKFAKLSADHVQRITFEIALRGQRGFDVNDPDKKYRFQSIPGDFSGLQAVAYMYVGFKQIAPEQNIGFDLAQEYRAARQLFNAWKG